MVPITKSIGKKGERGELCLKKTGPLYFVSEKNKKICLFTESGKLG